MALPELYLENMKSLLGEEYPAYMKSLEEPSYNALRVNTGKISPDEFCRISPFEIREIPWISKGFYYNALTDNPAKHPYYYAGLYYIQEPSAMIPASLLPVKKGDRVLDLCAAPGGKATELAARLDGTGLLVANDISVSRAMALAKNLQFPGAANTVVTAEQPGRLAEVLPEYFDEILIDAPCSGEGMFRRDPGMVKDWLEHGPAYYAPIQREILENAWKMLRPGGYMVYSTCTFSPVEDEGMIQWFIRQYPDMHICPVERREGFSEGRSDWVPQGEDELKHCVRIFPHKAKGEGHFAVLLRKEGGQEGIVDVAESTSEAAFECTFGRKGKDLKRKASGKKYEKMSGRQKEDAGMAEMEAFCQKVKLPAGIRENRNGVITLSGGEMGRVTGLRQIYHGLILGEVKKNRFEPSPQLALALSGDEFSQRLDLSGREPEAVKYLKGETLQMEGRTEKGNTLVCVDGFPLGWCKGDGRGQFKNKYYPGWRMQ